MFNRFLTPSNSEEMQSLLNTKNAGSVVKSTTLYDVVPDALLGVTAYLKPEDLALLARTSRYMHKIANKSVTSYNVTLVDEKGQKEIRKGTYGEIREFLNKNAKLNKELSAVADREDPQCGLDLLREANPKNIKIYASLGSCSAMSGTGLLVGYFGSNGGASLNFMSSLGFAYSSLGMIACTGLTAFTLFRQYKFKNKKADARAIEKQIVDLDALPPITKTMKKS